MTYKHHGRVLFGAAYYHEYHQTERLNEDLDLMVQANFSVIRVGESVWSTWEPENGKFDLDWLQPVLDGAHARGLKVILGTPTYAAPMWLARLYPEINVQVKSGQSFGWGQRQEIDYSHPAFLFHAERVIRKIMERYASHPAVIGFEVDNEPGFHLIHNDQVFQRFVDHLRTTYGTVERLNEEWGLTYWSHRLSTWADVWRPDANLQPQYDLAWRKFQAQITTDFINWQAEIAREYATEDQFVTCDLSYDRQTVQDEKLLEPLDVGAANLYYRMQESLGMPGPQGVEQAWTTTGTPALYWSANRAYGSKQAPFLITETNAQAISHQWQNEPAFDGQWRQVAWALISRGASMIEYWHWHTNVYGTETYWGGVLPHSLKPGRTYAQIAQLGQEIATAGEAVVDLTPDADVTFLFSNESKWALTENPQIGGYNGANPRGYQTIVDAFHDAAFHVGLQSRVAYPSQLLQLDPGEYAQTHRVLVAAGFIISTDEELAWLKAYAAAGGHLVLGIRTGYEDHEARARMDVQPAHFAQDAQVSYNEFSTIDQPIAVVVDAVKTGIELTGEPHGQLWIDGLVPSGAQVLATYEHPHFGRWAAATTTQHESGRITYVGTVPDRAFGEFLFNWVKKVSLPDNPWVSQHPQQTVSGATNVDGESLRFVHNWGWEATEFVLPAKVLDLLDGSEIEHGATISLTPWDVRVLKQV